jgi:hypothetical protein
MPDKSLYDINYRPTTYWNTPESTIANIKGEHRKRMVRRAIDSGEVAGLDERMLDESLSDEARDAVGRIHPAFMGGEYLPDADAEADEVEIARISLASVTFDVISVRARRENGKIGYRIVDEYESKIRCSPAESDKPLNLGELIDLIDGANGENVPGTGLTGCFRDLNYSPEWGKAENLVGFVTVTSEFYDELQEYYEEEAGEWLEGVLERVHA